MGDDSKLEEFFLDYSVFYDYYVLVRNKIDLNESYIKLKDVHKSLLEKHADTLSKFPNLSMCISDNFNEAERLYYK